MKWEIPMAHAFPLDTGNPLVYDTDISDISLIFQKQQADLRYRRLIMAKRQSMTEKVLEALREDIINWVYEENDMITEAEIS